MSRYMDQAEKALAMDALRLLRMDRLRATLQAEMQQVANVFVGSVDSVSTRAQLHASLTLALRDLVAVHGGGACCAYRTSAARAGGATEIATELIVLSHWDCAAHEADGWTVVHGGGM